VLRELGYDDFDLLPGSDRAPIWPEGVVGSITHCAGYTAAAATTVAEVMSLGIDAEVDAALPDEVAALVMQRTELRSVARLERLSPGVHWGRLLFSAKESVYKAWYPVRHEWLGFEEVQITMSLDGSFEALVLRDDVAPFAPSIAGRWSRHGGVVFTAVVVPWRSGEFELNRG
jgi:4'-phosphopantetheinyl transferase EntD